MSRHRKRQPPPVPRRLFSTGAFVLAARVLPESAWAQTPAPHSETKADSPSLNPSVYLGIEPDGTVFIVTHRSEMGTGIRTSLPLVAADELDADWSRCRIEQGVGDARYGDQNTDGSRSIRDFYDAFRRAGASARVDAGERGGGAVERAGGAVRGAATTKWSTQASNRRAGVMARSCPRPRSCRCRRPEDLQFKPKTGVEVRRQGDASTYDQTDIVTGKAQFGLDVYPRRAWCTRRSSTRRCSAAR